MYVCIHKVLTDANVGVFRFVLCLSLLGLGLQFRGCEGEVIAIVLSHSVGVDCSIVPANPNPSVPSWVPDDCTFTWTILSSREQRGKER